MDTDTAAFPAEKPPVSTPYRPSHIAGNPGALTERQRDLIAIAADLGQRHFAPLAAEVDAEARFPRENFERLREAGLLALAVPESHGGLGGDYLTCMLVVAEIGRHCAATALTFNMHLSACLWMGPVADGLDMDDAQRADHERHRKLHFERIARQGRIYAQPFSEGGPAAVGKAPWGTVARPVEGGYLVDGRKIFASLAGAADDYGVLCTLDQPGATQRETLYLAIPADAAGVKVVGDWDPLGMRGTVSRCLEFDQVFVRDSQRLLPEGAWRAAAHRFPHMHATLSAPYLGVAQAAYDYTVRFLRGEIDALPPVKRRMYPTKQHAVADLRIRLEQTRALFLQTAREAVVDPDTDARMRLFTSHYTVMENANAICALAMRTCGGQSMLRTLPLERYYRDSRCGSLMLPWSAELCIDHLGRECLYEPGELDEGVDLS